MQVRADDDVGFDGHHHHVQPALDRTVGVQRAGFFVSGRLDHNIELAVRREHAALDERHAAAAREIVRRAGGRRTRERVAVPARLGAGAARALGVQIGEHAQPHAGHQPELREDHRAELARADQPDADRIALRFTLREPAREVHTATASARASSVRQSSASVWMGVKSRCAMYSGREKRRIALSVRFSDK